MMQIKQNFLEDDIPTLKKTSLACSASICLFNWRNLWAFTNKVLFTTLSNKWFLLTLNSHHSNLPDQERPWVNSWAVIQGCFLKKFPWNILLTSLWDTFDFTCDWQTLHSTKIKFPIKDFFSKCDQIRRNVPIWSHLIKKPWMENFIFCAVKTSTNPHISRNVLAQ